MLIQNSNESLALIMVAMAQTVPVLAGGLDLSVGAVMTLVNCVASHVMVGSPAALLAGTVVCLAAGALAGFINGCVVVYGRLQPIIATLATGAVYLGIALYPAPDARAARSTRTWPGRSPTISTSWPPPMAGSTAAMPPGSSRSPGSRSRCC